MNKADSVDSSWIFACGITVLVFIFIGFMFWLLGGGWEDNFSYTGPTSSHEEMDAKENLYYQNIVR